MSLETAQLTEVEGPEHNARGFFIAGPQMVNPSDVLAKMIADAQGTLEERHYAPNPVEQARIERRAMFQRRMRRKYPAHGVTEFLRRIA